MIESKEASGFHSDLPVRSSLTITVRGGRFLDHYSIGIVRGRRWGCCILVSGQHAQEPGRNTRSTRGTRILSLLSSAPVLQRKETSNRPLIALILGGIFIASSPI